MPITIIAVGNGGYNLASDIKNAKLFTDAKLIVCDTDNKELANNAAQAFMRAGSGLSPERTAYRSISGCSRLERYTQ